ncbi:MAG: hypothetical protein IJ911_07015 [Salinivirgaceae bacterium]|nr:hypothetical protein [Salinivirgaceae bacterium]
MSKITFETPVKFVQGKLSKSDNSYFSVRNGKGCLTKCYNQYDGGNTAQQQAVRQRFANVQRQVSEELANAEKRAQWEVLFAEQNRHATLRGFVFASIYNS